jgi:hypothetical protein
MKLTCQNSAVLESCITARYVHFFQNQNEKLIELMIVVYLYQSISKPILQLQATYIYMFELILNSKNNTL